MPFFCKTAKSRRRTCWQRRPIRCSSSSLKFYVSGSTRSWAIRYLRSVMSACRFVSFHFLFCLFLDRSSADVVIAKSKTRLFPFHASLGAKLPYCVRVIVRPVLIASTNSCQRRSSSVPDLENRFAMSACPLKKTSVQVYALLTLRETIPTVSLQLGFFFLIFFFPSSRVSGEFLRFVGEL